MSGSFDPSALFPSGVRIAFAPLEEICPDPAAPCVHPDEERSITRAVEKRRREFKAGRALARRALGELGFERASEIPIPVGARREPIWPAGVIGTIAHTRTHGCAAVARAGWLRSVGVDLEPAEPLEEKLWSRILTPRELADVDGLSARLLFCAKEAVYKAQFPITRSFVDFHEVEVALLEKTFRARFLVGFPGIPAGTTWTGRIVRGGGILAASLTCARAGGTVA